MTTVQRLRNLLVQRILGIDDTPHRIAWGVFLGFVVAFSPTVGIQMIIYVAVATLLRANKVVGLFIVWLTNPVTVLPMYYMCWRLGSWALGRNHDPDRGQQMIATVVGQEDHFVWHRIVEMDFWHTVGTVLWSVGGELWLGGLMVGFTLGAAFYPLTYWGVQAYRRARVG